MAELKKLKIPEYEYAEPLEQASMDPVIDYYERRQTMVNEIQLFGFDAERMFRQSIKAIEKFLEDPTSPEADQSIRDKLRDDYLSAAQSMALTIGAGQEVLRRYDAHYLENAAELLYVATSGGSDGDNEQRCIANLIACRDVLHQRLQKMSKPEESHDFVCNAIARLEEGRQLSVSIARGLPLEEPISVRKTPLKLQRPGMGM
jgi:hypothetical protein